MTEKSMNNTNRRFDPSVAEELWRKKQQEQDKRTFMDPEKLADKVSDRLVKIMEEEIKKQQTKQAG